MFSVIIPTFNEKNDIERTLSILCSNLKHFGNYEIIVVDSGQDGTFEIAKRYTSKVYRYAKRGVSRARNYGVTKSSGDLLVFMDADVVTSVCNFQEVTEKFHDSKAVALVAKVDSYNGKNIFEKLFYILSWIGIDICKAIPFFLRFYNYGDFLIVRRSVFLKTKFNENMNILEITELLNNLSRYGKIKILSHYVYESSRRVKQWGVKRLSKIYAKNFIMYYLGSKHDEGYEVIR